MSKSNRLEEVCGPVHRNHKVGHVFGELLQQRRVLGAVRGDVIQPVHQVTHLPSAHSLSKAHQIRQ